MAAGQLRKRGSERRRLPNNTSSFPRKRESGGGRPQYRPVFPCGNAAMDSRFRGNDEDVTSAQGLDFFGVRSRLGGCLFGSMSGGSAGRRRDDRAPRFDPACRCSDMFVPRKSVRGNRAALTMAAGQLRKRGSERRRLPNNTSSFPRKRESGGGRPQYRPVFPCGNAAMDSRFRGNDEALSEGYRLPPRHFFGAPTVVARDIRFPRMPESGNYRCRGGFSQFRRALSCSDGGFGNVARRRERDPAAGEAGYAEVS